MIQGKENLILLQNAIDSQTAKHKYNQKNSIKPDTQSIKSSLFGYSDAFILVKGEMNNDTDGAFKHCAPFYTCKTEINDAFINETNHIYIAMPMYNLIEYSDNCSDTSGSLWQFKRDDVSNDNADLATDNSESFKYKVALVGKIVNAVNNANSSIKITKIPLKYLSNFYR